MITHQIVDIQTGAIIAGYTQDKRIFARRRAEKMNLAYGAHRYAVKLVS